MKTSTVAIIALLVVALAFLTGFLSYNNGTVSYNSTAVHLQGVGSSTQSGQLAQLPLITTVTNSLAGSQAVGTESIYQGKILVDSGTLVNGSYTSTVGYTPGEQLNVKVVNSTTIEWYQVTVPQASSVQSSSQSYSVHLNFYTLGSFKITMSDQLGNTYATGACFNESALAGSTAQCGGGAAAAKPGTKPSILYVSITNSKTNSGYVSSYDPINVIPLNALLVISSAGQASITGADQVLTRGSTQYYVDTLADQSLTCQTIGQTISCGSAKPAYTVDIGSLAHGSSETETVFTVLFGSTTNFQQLGTWGPNAITTNPASQTLKVAY